MNARLPVVKVLVLAGALLALCTASWCVTSAATLWQAHTFAVLPTRTVYAYRQWQSIGLHLNAGDRVRLTASGQWSYSPEVGLHGPEGALPAPNYYPLPAARGGALLGRLGDAGNIFYVGSFLNYLAPEPGFLYLRINDDLLGDNIGTLTIKIEVEPAPTAPAKN